MNIDRLNTGVNQTKNKLEASTDTLAGSKTRLETACRLACGAVLASGREMKEIFSRLKQPYRHLADTESITALISDAKIKIGAIHEQMQQLQHQVFSRYGLSQWEEKEADLKLLTEQFTSYVERKALTTVAGSVLEDIGSSGGDIVLF